MKPDSHSTHVSETPTSFPTLKVDRTVKRSDPFGRILWALGMCLLADVMLLVVCFAAEWRIGFRVVFGLFVLQTASLSLASACAALYVLFRQHALKFSISSIVQWTFAVALICMFGRSDIPGKVAVVVTFIPLIAYWICGPWRDDSLREYCLRFLGTCLLVVIAGTLFGGVLTVAELYLKWGLEALR